MTYERKRQIRLVVSLGAAVLLAVGLLYTSFTASTDAREPSEVLAAGSGESSTLTGRVAEGSVERDGEKLIFDVTDRESDDSRVRVVYSGAIPDPFRQGREVIVTGTLEGETFEAERDSLITKCPSKFTEEDQGDEWVGADGSTTPAE